MDKRMHFMSSVLLDKHPMKHVKGKIKEEYYYVLEYFVSKSELDDVSKCRLEQYKALLVKSDAVISKEKIEQMIATIVTCRFMPWRKKYRCWLLCDAALILLDEALVKSTADSIKAYLTQRQQRQIESLVSALSGKLTDITAFVFAEELITQYRTNIRFLQAPEKRFIVTANMSAGKSTLINAIIGKPLARMSQEVCTGNVGYLWNKPFEDGLTHLETSQLNLFADESDLASVSWDSATNFAAYFRGLETINHPLCIIDTPGVNSAINRKHGRIARDAVQNQQYDKAIYVLNANKLGTDEEMSHLRWISENVPREKILFVVNKLDTFVSADDDIRASIERVKQDLVALGFKSPTICPISAYFALLIKMKHCGDLMSADEMDEYDLLRKKFSKPVYDLSKYYIDESDSSNDSEIVSMSKKCGLYGLEKILFGGGL